MRTADNSQSFFFLASLPVIISSMRISRVLSCTVAAIVFAFAISAAPSPEGFPILPGLPNLAQVSTNLYRCAQPTADGFMAAGRLGVKTVISLRAFHTDAPLLASTNLKFEHIYFKTWHPEEEDVLRFLKIVSNTNNGPFLLHCQHGADRTGMMVAIYRMAVDGWTKDAAIKEMTDGGYGYHAIWKNLTRYLRKLDVAALRAKAGLPTRASNNLNPKGLQMRK